MVAALAPVGMAASVAVAQAAPGAPQPPKVVFTEDFESVDAPGVAQQLNTYTGAPPLEPTYTAHPAWLNGAACNGVIASFNSVPGATGCPQSVFTTWIRSLASSMGSIKGGGDDNVVLGDVTIAGFPAPPTPAPTLETVKAIPLPSTNRYITFGIDVAVSCQGVPPLLRFFLLDGGSAISTNNSVINPCTAPGGTPVDPPGPVTSGRVGSFASDKALLLSSPSIKLRLTNDQTSGNGNDYVVDNIRVLDATPSLHKAFSPERINPPGQPNATSALTFTVTNTTELGEKAGWSFTDQLPTGVTIAGPASSDCPAAVTSGAAGDTTFTATGTLATGMSSCTVTVPVQAAPGTYVNGPGNVSTAGLDEPAEPATLSVNTPPTADVDGPSEGEEYFVGQDVRADYACDDVDGTVTSCQGPVADGEPIDTASPGTKEFAVTATDDDGATATARVTYRVRAVAGLCRGTPVRALGLDPATANPPESPCSTDRKSMLRVNARIGNAPPGGLLNTVANMFSSVVVADAIEGSTVAGLASARGEAHVVEATVTSHGMVIRAQGVHAEAASRLTTGCNASQATWRSSIATLTINGVPRLDLDEPMTIPLPGLGAVHLNQTAREGNTVTQRAVFVDLPGDDLDVAIGEARAGVACI